MKPQVLSGAARYDDGRPSSRRSSAWTTPASGPGVGFGDQPSCGRPSRAFVGRGPEKASACTEAPKRAGP